MGDLIALPDPPEITFAFAPSDDCPQTFEDALDAALADARAVMIERQRKYGPLNMTAFGEKGVVVRAFDKLARLRHFHFEGGSDAPDESVTDSWIDLLNYSAIALMLRRGTWGLPLEDDAH